MREFETRLLAPRAPVARGALEAVGGVGGDMVESDPEDAEGRRLASAFLHDGSASMFERHAFSRLRPHRQALLGGRANRGPLRRDDFAGGQAGAAWVSSGGRRREASQGGGRQ